MRVWVAHTMCDLHTKKYVNIVAMKSHNFLCASQWIVLQCMNGVPLLLLNRYVINKTVAR